MASFEKYTQQRKKKEYKGSKSFYGYTMEKTKKASDDIAPVREDKNTTDLSDEKEEESYFRKKAKNSGSDSWYGGDPYYNPAAKYDKMYGSGAISWDEQAPMPEKATEKQPMGTFEKISAFHKGVKDLVTPEKKNNDGAWFKGSSYFDDGYDFGDISKTILGSVGDLLEDAATGIIGFGEKALDSFVSVAPYLAQNAYEPSDLNNNQQAIQMHNQAAEASKAPASDFVQKDLYDEEKVAKAIISNPIRDLTGFDIEGASIFGEKTDALAQSGGQMLLTAGLQTVGVPWWLTTGVSAFGGQAETALKEGAELDEAILSATVSTGAEILTEKLFGGSGLGEKGLINIEGLTKGITNKVIKTLVDYGVDITAEGFEEVFTEFINNLGTALYKEEKLTDILFSEEALQGYIDSYIGGMALSGFMNSPKAYKSVKSGTDYRLDLSQNEQKVFDKEYENRLTEETEAKGEALTHKEEVRIYDSVVRDIEKGYIATDTIESVLGGETYKAYKDSVDSEKALQDEFDALNKMKAGEMTGEQTDRRAELKQQLQGLKNNSNNSKLQERLSSEVMELVKDSKLSESYNEKLRRAQKFEADLTKYNGKQLETVKRAVQSGVLNNTNRTHDFVDMIAKISADKGVSFDFTSNQKLKESGFAVEGRTVNGFVKGGKVSLNINSAKALNSVVGHEITHVLEGTDLYDVLKESITEYAKSKGEYQKRLAELSKLYEGVENADVEAELIADLVGDYLFTDSDFVSRLLEENPSLFKKIFNEIKYLCKVATAGSKEAKQLEKVKRTFEKAYRETKAEKNTAEGSVRYSFAGIKAKTSNIQTFEAAQRLEDVGKATPEEIRQKTGWFRGYDGMWRFELDDSKMVIRDTDIRSGETKLSEVLDYPQLFEAYPQLKDVTISAFPSIFRFGVKGSYNSERNEISLSDEFLVDAKVHRELEALKKSDEYKTYKERLESAAREHGEKRLKLSREFKKIREAKLYTDMVDLLYQLDDEGKVEEYKKATEEWQNSALGKRYGEISAELKRMDEVNPQSEIEKAFRESEIGKRYHELTLDVFSGGEVINDKDTRNTLIHEIQHAIQHIEGFASGASPKYWKDINADPFSYTPSEIKKLEAVREKASDYLNMLDDEDIREDAQRYWYLNDHYFDDNLDTEAVDKEIAEIESRAEAFGYQDKLDRYFELENKVTLTFNEIERRRKRSPDELYRNTAGEIEARDATARLALTTEERKNTRPDIDRKDVVFSDGGVSWMSAKKAKYDPEIASISEQIRNSQSILNSMDVVGEATAPQVFKDKYEAGQWAISQLKAFGYQVDRQNFGKIYFGESDIKEGINYADTNAEKAALILIPKVLKRGIEIGHHGNHKLRQKETITFAGPVILNGIRGNMAVVVNMHGNKYSVHRILLPDGSSFKFSEKNNEVKQESYQGVTENSSLADTTSFTSVNSILNSIKNVKQDGSFSLSADNPTPQKYGNYNVYGDDVRYQPDDIAPVREDLQVAKPETMTEDIAPVREDITPKRKAIREKMDYITEFEETNAKVEADEVAKNVAERPTKRSELHHSIVENIKAKFTEKGFDFDKVLENAKNMATIRINDNTPQRVMKKTFGPEEGDILADETVNKVAQNETEGIKWLNSYLDRKNGVLVQISKQYGIKPGSKESAAAQKYAEGFYVDKKSPKKPIYKYDDAKLAQEFPDIKTQSRIKGLARDPRIRQIYDETLDAINEARKRNLYPEIPKRDNYFLHFHDMEDTFSTLGLPFNLADIRAKDLPTNINGITADLKPGQPYFPSAQERKGIRTSFDLLGGLERYLTSAKNQIYHIDDIQTLRALRNYIADSFGRAEGLESLDNMTDEEAEHRITQVYKSHLSNFAKFLNEEANVIAGKTVLIDRGIEGLLGRRAITFLDDLNKQVGSNLVGYNISSPLTNVIPVVQTFAKTNKFDFLKAFAQTASNKVNTLLKKDGDGFTEKSPVIIRRKGAEQFYRKPYQKIADVGYVLMSAVDNISTELIARTKFNEFTRKGMNEQQAHFETDKWVSGLMGDRSLGQLPMLYNSKLLNMVVKFQLEVRIQLDSQFYDTIQEAKLSNKDIENGLLRNAKTAAKVTSTFFQLAVAQHLFGKAFEAVAGYNPAFDIIETIIKSCGFDDDEEDEDTVLDNIEEALFALAEDMPYANLFVGGGRIPVSSALPIGELWRGEDQYGNEKPRGEILKDAVPYYILPGGYGQIKKTVNGLKMFDDDFPVAGSYTDSGSLRFPVEETPGNILQAFLFGQYANKNAQTYFDEGYAPLKEKQIEEYKELDVPIADYWKIREGLSGLKTLNEKGDYIGGLDLSVEKKNLLINNIAGRETPIDMTDYHKYSDFQEFDFATRYPEKYKDLQEQGLSVKEYKEKYEESVFMYTDDFSWAANNPEQYAVSKAVSDDVTEYKKYTADLYNIKADKDKNGKSISGSRKKKVVDYINGLNIDYGAKIILFKKEYSSDDTYNMEILEYLNSRSDITYTEKVTILTELGFDVDSDGRVTW